MPGLPYQNLPAEQVNKIRNQIQGQWQIEANALNNTWFANRGSFETAKAKMLSKYQMMEFQSMQKLQQQVEEQQQEQAKREQLLGLARQRREGGLPPGQQVEQRLGVTAGQWTATAPSKGLSFTQMESPSLIKGVSRYAESAPSKGLWFTRESKEPKTKTGLIDAYNRWKDWMDYDEQNYAVQEDLDKVWDTQMVSDSRYDKWWKDVKKRTVHQDIKIARHKGGKYAEAGKMQALGMSPFAKSVKKPGKMTSPLGMGWQPESRESAGLSRQDLLSEYRRLGGSGTAAGRAFADKNLR